MRGSCGTQTAAAKRNDCTMESAWATTTSRCRFQRSTSTPAKGAKMKVGSCPAKPTSPSSIGAAFGSV